MAHSNAPDESSDDSRRDLPLLPLRDIVVFPDMVVPLFVGRERSISALEEAMNEDETIVLAAQRRDNINEPTEDDVYDVGTVGNIVQLLRLPDGTVKVLVKGLYRVHIDEYVSNAGHFRVAHDPIDPPPVEIDDELEDLMEAARSAFETYVDLNNQIPPDAFGQVEQLDIPDELADTIAAQLSLDLDDKQSLLETLNPTKRLETLYELIQEQIEDEAERKIRSRVKQKMDNDDSSERETSNQFQQQMQDRQSVFADELEEMEDRIEVKEMPQEVTERLRDELQKLKMMSPMSAEATVVRNYIDRVLELPWYEMTEDRLDIETAEETLEADHYGLEQPKDRILEYLAVRSMADEPSGTILCFVGPPGVGKTSLGRSIARATNRNFVRLSLGGIRDEAEIRGHRRTYIGSMPGKIIRSIDKAGSNNPVFLLDEIDKMSADFRGDPASAMLEVLDPEQNDAFKDHYLDLDYDLSNVMFICTANQLQPIPAPLQDRMETIRIPGYTSHEKVQIGQKYLVPKQIESTGLEDIDVHFTSSALDRIVNEYTREAGVRNLEREVGSICRKIARKVVEGESDRSFTIRARTVPTYLGPSTYEGDEIEDEHQIGIANGVAWTQNGGVMLTNEVTVMPGNGDLILTGKLGDVMEESARAAMSYVRARALNLGLDPHFHEKVDLHIHFPEGALPKDGPSAGITMVTSIVSALTQTPIRRTVAMTGELSLRGRVLKVGGLKEKLVAAYRGGVEMMIIPDPNQKDLQEVPARVKRGLEIVPIEHMDEVLARALLLDDPEAFLERLQQPLIPPEVLRNDRDEIDRVLGREDSSSQDLDQTKPRKLH